MPTPLSTTRRIELLEGQLADQKELIDGLIGRLDRAQGKRWAYLAKTASAGYYPDDDGANTFGLTFLDRQYTAAEGIQAVTDVERSAGVQAIGTTINGQWVMEGETVLAIPAPPPPSTSGKGRWSIIPIRTYYWGKLLATLSRRSSANVAVWRLTTGGWVDSTFTQKVWDRLLEVGVELESDTWVKFSWEPSEPGKGRWVVDVSGCSPDAAPEG